MLWTLGGASALVAGHKLTSLSLLSKGFSALEADWRARHHDLPEGLLSRLRAAMSSYEERHQDPRNRQLHLVAIPLSFGGGIGLLIWPRYSPPWLLSLGGFGIGLGLELLGHALFEKHAPLFSEDPLSPLTGPIWELGRLGRSLRS